MWDGEVLLLVLGTLVFLGTNFSYPLLPDLTGGWVGGGRAFTGNR